MKNSFSSSWFSFSSKKGQIVVLTSIFVIFIFLLMITLFSNYLFFDSPDDKSSFVEHEALRVADNLMLSGYPSNWDLSSVWRFGLVDNNFLNSSKLTLFEEFVSANYSQSKALLGVVHDFVVFVNDGNSNFAIGAVNDISEIYDGDFSFVSSEKRVLLSDSGVVHLTVVVFAR